MHVADYEQVLLLQLVPSRSDEISFVYFSLALSNSGIGVFVSKEVQPSGS
jgi:hypothetical protein